MAYEKQAWKGLPDKTTPITPERLNHMEDGIANSVDKDSEQSIDGVKTFNQLPVSDATPTNNNQLVNKKYADSIIKIGTTTGKTFDNGFYLLGEKNIFVLSAIFTSRTNGYLIPYAWGNTWYFKCKTNQDGNIAADTDVTIQYE